MGNSESEVNLPSAPNRVLYLDGSNSYIELPSDLFTNLNEATVEGWVKWDTLGSYSRFFDVGINQNSILVSHENDTLYFEAAHQRVNSTEPVRAGTWCHIAAVTGQEGMKLYCNGRLLGTNAYAGSFSLPPTLTQSYLGKSNWGAKDTDFQGAMDEVRVWAVSRNPGQIRQNMFKRLKGNEPGLLALWNFDNPANPGADSSLGAHHAKLMGKATTVQMAPPAAMLSGTVADLSGRPVAAARVEVHDAARQVSSVTSDASGHYQVMVSGHCDLFVTTGKLSAYQLGFEPSGEGRQHLDWTLADPDDRSSRRQEALTPRLATRDPQSAMDQSFLTPAATNFPGGQVVTRVLTDDQGKFRFPNVRPGRYQVRAQMLGGKQWFDGGRIMYASADVPDAERASMQSLEFRIAPFKKGHWTPYDSSSGLPPFAIRKLDLDPEGVLWIATLGGVCRFDGNDFVTLTTEDGLLDDRVYNLCRDEKTGLWWFSTELGLSRYDPAAARQGRRAFTNFRSEECHLEGRIDAIARSPVDGAMWFASFGKLARFAEGQFVGYPLPKGIGIIFKMAADPKGLIWLGTWNGLVRFDGMNFVNVTQQLGIQTGADNPEPQPDGSIWFGNITGEGTHSGLFQYSPGSTANSPGQVRNWTQRDGLLSDIVYGAHRAADGRLWVATAQGLSLFDHDGFVNFTTVDGLTGSRVLTLLPTRDGTVWLGTQEGRLFRYEPDRLSRFTRPDGDILPTIHGGRGWDEGLAPCSTAPDGTLWFVRGLTNWGATSLLRTAGRSFETIQLPPALSSSPIVSLTAATDGSIWLALSGMGLVRYAHGDFNLLSITNGLPSDDVR
jgi:hypothetical protein